DVCAIGCGMSAKGWSSPQIGSPGGARNPANASSLLPRLYLPRDLFARLCCCAKRSARRVEVFTRQARFGDRLLMTVAERRRVSTHVFRVCVDACQSFLVVVR